MQAAATAAAASGCNFIKSQNFHFVLCSFDHIGFVRCCLSAVGAVVWRCVRVCDDDDDDGDIVACSPSQHANGMDSLAICSFATMNYEWPEVNIT